MNTCDKCKNYKFTDMNYGGYEFSGECAKAGDSNNHPCPEDGIVGWDYESYSAGVYVGPKFGCIHWEGKEGDK